MPAKTVWTPERARKLKRLVKDGTLVVTLAQASALTGVKHYALVSYCQAHNIKSRYANVWTPRHQARLASYVRNGRLTLPLGEAATKLGVPSSVLSGQLARQNIETLNSAAEVRRRIYAGILALTKKGVLTVPIDIACARINCSRYAAEDAIKDLKIKLPIDLPRFRTRMGKPTVFTPDALETLDRIRDESGALTMPIAAAAKRLRTRPKTLGNYIRRTKATLPHVQRYDWTTARKRALRSLCSNGVLTVTTYKAASLLGCSLGQLRRGLALTGLTPKPKTKWTREKVLSLGIFDTNGRLAISIKEACLKLGTDRKTLRSITATINAPPYARYDWTPERDAKLRGFARHGTLTTPLATVMRAMGCSEKVLRHALARLGIKPRPHFSWTSDAIAKLEALKGKDGKLTVTYDKAAALIGCGPRSVEHRLLGNNTRH